MFDVIIPTYKNLGSLQHCLEGFENQTVKDFKIKLCINGDPKPVLDFLKGYKGNLQITPLSFQDKQNHGRAANRNQAIPVLTSRYILYQDSDLFPAPDLLEKHLEQLDKQDCISLGMVEYTNKSTNIWAKYQYYTGRARYRFGDEVPFHYLNTQNVAFRAEYLIGVEGQMESLIHYGGDDTELGYRLHHKYKLPVIFNPEAVSIGTMDKTLDKALKDVYEFGKFNFPKILRNHPDFEEIYKIGKYRRSAWLRFLIHLPIDRLLRVFLFLAPVRMVHYLTIHAVYKGLKDSGYFSDPTL